MITAERHDTMHSQKTYSDVTWASPSTGHWHGDRWFPSQRASNVYNSIKLLSPIFFEQLTRYSIDHQLTCGIPTKRAINTEKISISLRHHDLRGNSSINSKQMLHIAHVRPRFGVSVRCFTYAILLRTPSCHIGPWYIEILYYSFTLS